jgi:hypothetical protein
MCYYRTFGRGYSFRESINFESDFSPRGAEFDVLGNHFPGRSIKTNKVRKYGAGMSAEGRAGCSSQGAPTFHIIRTPIISVRGYIGFAIQMDDKF